MKNTFIPGLKPDESLEEVLRKFLKTGMRKISYPLDGKNKPLTVPEVLLQVLYSFFNSYLLNAIPKDKNSENVPKLGNMNVVLTHCNLAHKNCQYSSAILYIFAPNELFGQLLVIKPSTPIFSKSFKSKFTYILELSYLIKILICLNKVQSKFNSCNLFIDSAIIKMHVQNSIYSTEPRD